MVRDPEEVLAMCQINSIEVVIISILWERDKGLISSNKMTDIM